MEEERVTLEEAYKRGGYWKFDHQTGPYYLITPLARSWGGGKVDDPRSRHALCGQVLVFRLKEGVLQLDEFTTDSLVATHPGWERCHIKLTAIISGADE